MDSLLRLDDLFEVKGYCVCEGEEEFFETQKNCAYARSVMLTLDEILNDPKLDAVVIETFEGNLTKYAQMAIDKGLHVHMDKPGSPSMETFEKLVRSAQVKNLTVHLGYMYRYNPAVQHVIKEVKNGKLGQIYSVEAQMNCLHTSHKRQWLEKLPGGMMYYLGCHLIDLILQIQGMPEEIIPLNTCSDFDNVTAADFGMAILKYSGGVSFAKTSAVEPGGFLRRQLVVCGEKGTIEIKPFEKYVATVGRERNLVSGVRETSKEDADKFWWNYQGAYWETEPINRYDPMMEAFAAMVRGDKKNPYSYEYEIQLYHLLLEACGV